MTKKKILIIDDEDDFCFFVKLNLQKTGKYEVFTATDGLQGIDLARRLKPDLIFLDIIMPKMGGMEVANRLLADELTRKIPFIFISAFIKNFENAECGRHSGAKDFIAKPVLPEQLIKKLELMLVDNYLSLMQSHIAGQSMAMCFFSLQHILLMTLFSATLFLASISIESTADAGSNATQVTVSAKVLARSNIKMFHYTPLVTISKDDIRKGYVDVKNAVGLEIKSNKSGSLSLIFQDIALPFREIYVKGLTNETRIDSGNSYTYQSYHHGTVIVDLSYRLFFTENVRCGTYNLPRIIGELH